MKNAFIMLLLVLFLIATPVIADDLLSSNEVLNLQTSEIKIGIQEVAFNIISIQFDYNVEFIKPLTINFNYKLIANRSENGYNNNYSLVQSKNLGDILHYARHSTKLIT